MPRPFCKRLIGFSPSVTYFKPAGVPLRMLEEVSLKLDELEALRLADLEAMHQEDAAKKMNISRATFGRVVESARKKVADALMNGKALRVEGGPVEILPTFNACGIGRYHSGGRGRGWCHGQNRQEEEK